VNLKIVQGFGNCPLNFEGIGIDTFLLDKNGYDIPFTPVNGYYDYRQSSTFLKVINPLTGDGWFNFTAAQKNVGDTFVINLTIADVSNLFCWQFFLTWNPSLLTYSNATIPPDNIFGSRTIVTAIDTSLPGQIGYGAALLDPSQAVSGSGTLAQVTLKITQGFGRCPLNFASIGIDTFLLDKYLVDIPFTPVNGYYDYRANPTPIPTLLFFNLNPNPAKIGDTVVLKGILIGNVSQPVKNENVMLYARPLTGNWTYITSVKTNDYGIFSWQVVIPNVPKGTYTFAAYYPGSTLYKSNYNFAILTIQ
jgi:hypothetical protein